MAKKQTGSVAEAAEALRPTKGSVTLSTGGKSVTLHADGRTESEGLNGSAASVVESVVEQVGGVAPPSKDDGPGPLNMVSMVRVPTKLGPVCAEEDSKYMMTSVGIKREADGACLLWATDGRMCAIVPGECEDFGEETRPTRIPRGLAVPTKEGARELHCGVGNRRTIFGFERVWVDEADGRFQPEAMDGTDPPLSDVFPRIDQGEHVFIGLNAQLLLDLAKAVNSPVGPYGLTGVVLAINLNDQQKPIAVIGDTGVGVLMPIACNRELDGPRYAGLVKRMKKSEGM